MKTHRKRVQPEHAVEIRLYGGTRFPVAARYIVTPEDPNHQALVGAVHGKPAPYGIQIGGRHFGAIVLGSGSPRRLDWCNPAPELPTELPPPKQYKPRAKPEPMTTTIRLVPGHAPPAPKLALRIPPKRPIGFGLR